MFHRLHMKNKSIMFLSKKLFQE